MNRADAVAMPRRGGPRRRPLPPGGTWAVVLAGGEGSRLRALTTTAAGVAVPKQFCSLRGGASLLEEALQRATSVAPVDRVCAVVAAQHAQWWCRPLAGLAPSNVFVQPHNRGTAVGILLALIHILERDPAASIVLLPADHHVGEEAVLARALGQAVATTHARPTDVVLLGVTPEDADPELGYIVPADDVAGTPMPVARFVEKPSVPEAEALIARGALWNVFIVAARATALRALFEQHDPGLLRRMRFAVRRALLGADPTTTLADLYARLRSVDFSRDIAQRFSAALRVQRVPACAWNDLGTVQRVTKTLLAMSRLTERPLLARAGGFLSLEQQHLAARAPQFGLRADL